MAETSGGLSAGRKSPAEGAGATNISYLPVVNPTNGGTVVSAELQGPLRYVARGEAQGGRPAVGSRAPLRPGLPATMAPPIRPALEGHSSAILQHQKCPKKPFIHQSWFPCTNRKGFTMEPRELVEGQQAREGEFHPQEKVEGEPGEVVPPRVSGSSGSTRPPLMLAGRG